MRVEILDKDGGQYILQEIDNVGFVNAGSFECLKQEPGERMLKVVVDNAVYVLVTDDNG